MASNTRLRLWTRYLLNEESGFNLSVLTLKFLKGLFQLPLHRSLFTRFQKSFATNRSSVSGVEVFGARCDWKKSFRVLP